MYTVQCKTVAGENFGESVTLRVWQGKLWQIAMNYPAFLRYNNGALN